MSIIRWILGSLILTFNWLFSPRSITRTPEAQAAIDARTTMLTLYHYRACPFCVKVRRAMKRQSLVIGTLDVKRSDTAKNELLMGGGNLKVPCLKIDDGDGKTRWMYESSDIINYLEHTFMSPETAL